MHAVEIAILNKNLNENFNPSICTVIEKGNLNCDVGELKVEVNGQVPKVNGTVTIKDGEVIGNTLVFGEEVSIEEESIDTTGAVVDVIEGLTPVKYNGSNWIVADENKKNWYDYEKQEWANAVILNAGITKSIGDTVDVSSEVKAMLVYVPRHEYKIEGQYGKNGISAEQPGEIEVNFITKETTTGSKGYRVHPAFTFGTEQLSGIWVGKFETTGTGDNPTILPSVASLVKQSISDQFKTSQKFNSYLINGDSHMAKNSEWGAVAYLSQSKYGKYGNPNYTGKEKEVMINNCSKIMTGIGADVQNASSSSATCTTNTYETNKGQAASTTGNITGIYDMSGGANEYVMGNYNNRIGSSEFVSMPNIKYFDKYTSTTLAKACNGEVCYGQALSETNNWYGDYMYFADSNSPWFVRGGNYFNASEAGVFYLLYANGNAVSFSSFRIAVVQTK